jgi:membrane protein CcdC involved in cytochrome C biogenesis
MIDILLALGIPLMAGFVLTLLRAVATQKKLSLETTQDVALDATFLAIGAAGSVFNDSKVRAMLGANTAAWMLGLIFVDLFIASCLLYLRRFAAPLTRRKAAVNILLGGLTLLMVAGVICLGSVRS